MRAFYLPIFIFAFFASMVTLHSKTNAMRAPTPAALQATQAGQTFVAYAQALAVFQSNNPTFTGSVTAAQISAQGTPFSSAFLQTAGNAITATGVNGRVITAYATLPGGALQAVTKATSYDASYGTSSGTSWTSIAPGATAQPLATTVPNASIVSVIQVGQ